MKRHHMKSGIKRVTSVPCAIGAILAMLVGDFQAQQVPIPQTAAEAPGPAPGPMTKASLQMVGRMAYVWGWPLVYVYEPAHGTHEGPRNGSSRRRPAYRSDVSQVVMLTGYISPAETFVDIPNQDVVYGLGWLSLANEPVVVVKCLTLVTVSERTRCTSARTDEISELGLQYGTKPGFYMVVGPNWKGATPDGIAGVEVRFVHRLRRSDAARLHE